MSNHLSEEKSPYLLQHQHNPVDWYPWGREAFELAMQRDRPIFLSIGYSTCYWCHVMEKESFEREEVAKVLNESFVSIKVDREERPDIDQLYMEAVVALTGHGGWPMSVFLTPEGKPFWGGTYFPKDHFLTILSRLQEAWTEDRSKVLSSADEISHHIFGKELRPGDAPISSAECQAIVSEGFHTLQRSFDRSYGGFSSAPKFPPSLQIGFLLRSASWRSELQLRAEDQEEAMNMATDTLNGMVRGGIFDHVGGGFHRYSVDERWEIPHFEKMLYDNGLLASVYAEAYQKTQDPLYRFITVQTLDFMERELLKDEGGFSSALDAGDVGTEGEFYVWNMEDIRAVTSEKEFLKVESVFQLRKEGNFEGKIHLNVRGDALLPMIMDPFIREILERLRIVREGRERPRLDDKVLSGWNGLALSAFTAGYRITQDTRYRTIAENTARFLETHLYDGTRLYRRYRDGERKFYGYAEDYAFVIEGLISLYQCSFEPHWLDLARKLQDSQNTFLWDTEKAGYQVGEAEDIPFHRKEFMDGALPSSHSTSIGNLLKLSLYYADPSYREKALAIFQVLSPSINKYPIAFSKALHSLPLMMGEGQELVIGGGTEGNALVSQALHHVWNQFFPDMLLGFATEDASSIPILHQRNSHDGRVAFYLCTGNTCLEPVYDTEKLIKILGEAIRREAVS